MTENVNDITVILVNGGSTFAEGAVEIDGKNLPCTKIEIVIEPMREAIDFEDDRPARYGETLIVHIPMYRVDMKVQEGTIDILKENEDASETD